MAGAAHFPISPPPLRQNQCFEMFVTTELREQYEAALLSHVEAARLKASRPGCCSSHSLPQVVFRIPSSHTRAPPSPPPPLGSQARERDGLRAGMSNPELASEVMLKGTEEVGAILRHFVHEARTCLRLTAGRRCLCVALAFHGLGLRPHFLNSIFNVSLWLFPPLSWCAGGE